MHCWMYCFMLCLVQLSEGWGSSIAPDRSRCKSWNPGVLFLQLQDGGDWPRAGRAEGQHGASVEQGCSPRLEQLPFSSSWLSYKAELQGNCTLCAANPFRGHLSQVTRCPAPDTLKGRRRCLDIPTSPSPAPVCDFFLVLVRRFFRREAKHTKFLWKEFKVFYSTCTFTTEKEFSKIHRYHAWPKFFCSFILWD